jgi:hypothetical protein
MLTVSLESKIVCKKTNVTIAKIANHLCFRFHEYLSYRLCLGRTK